MRMIRVGDEVQAFLDVRIKGIVVEIVSKPGPWMVGGTAQQEMFCVLKLNSGQQIKYPMGELHHSDV